MDNEWEGSDLVQFLYIYQVLFLYGCVNASEDLLAGFVVYSLVTSSVSF